jgi:histidine triad (HIT) family protein
VERVDGVFCDIVAGSSPAYVLYQDDRAMAFLDIHPATLGHTLVIARHHASDIWSLTPEDAAGVAHAALVVATSMREALNLSGLNLVHASGALAGQSVFHFHFHLHLVPRREGDGLLRPWSPTNPDASTLEEVARRIRRARERSSPEDRAP